ncbi:unnamed protein product [Sphagnum compactum]
MSSAMSSLSWQGYHKCLVKYTLRYDGSTPTFVRAKRKIVERLQAHDELEARRARLLAGVRRVHPLCCQGKAQARLAAQRTTSAVACRTATSVRAAVLLHWSHDRISLASRQVAISSALFLLQSWLPPRSPTVVVAVYSSHHLLHARRLLRPKSFGDGQETVGTGRSKPSP